MDQQPQNTQQAPPDQPLTKPNLKPPVQPPEFVTSENEVTPTASPKRGLISIFFITILIVLAFMTALFIQHNYF